MTARIRPKPLEWVAVDDWHQAETPLGFYEIEEHASGCFTAYRRSPFSPGRVFDDLERAKWWLGTIYCADMEPIIAALEIVEGGQ